MSRPRNLDREVVTLPRKRKPKPIKRKDSPPPRILDNKSLAAGEKDDD